jgi:hypothetical protein
VNGDGIIDSRTVHTTTYSPLARLILPSAS